MQRSHGHVKQAFDGRHPFPRVVNTYLYAYRTVFVLVIILTGWMPSLTVRSVPNVTSASAVTAPSG